MTMTFRFEPGQRVELGGLKTDTEYNGRRGVVDQCTYAGVYVRLDETSERIFCRHETVFAVTDGPNKTEEEGRLGL